MSDLVERLRQIYDDEGVPQKAADRIEALEDRYEAWKSVADGHLMRVKELEWALREIATDAENENLMLLAVGHHCGDGILNIADKARRALESKP